MKRSCVPVWCCLAVAFVSCLATCDAFAQRSARTNNAPAPADIDRRSSEVLAEMSGYLSGLDRYRVRLMASVHDGAEEGSRGTAIMLNYDLAVAKPNKFALLPKGGGSEITIVSDGSQVYIYSKKTNQYFVKPAPPTLAGMIKAEELAQLAIDMFPLHYVEMLLADNPQAHIASIAKKVEFVEPDDENKDLVVKSELPQLPDHRCLEYEDQRFKAELFVRDGAKPLLDRVIHSKESLKDGYGYGSLVGEDATAADVTLVFSRWQPNGKIPGRLFRFRKPPGAKQVDSFQKLMFDESYKPLLGETAPEVQFSTGGGRGGKSTKLSDHRDQHAVVLCFWNAADASSIGTVQALAQFAESQKTRVAFYPIHVKSATDMARKALSDMKVAAPPTVDSDGRIAFDYKVRAVPHIVVIDREGKVRAVHSGIPDNLSVELLRVVNEIFAE